MYFKQIIREDLGCAAYLVGSTDAGVLAVVDPRVDMVDEILSLAGSKGMRITHIVETHNHADHVSGHGRLMEETGATVHIHPDARVDYPHKPLHDGTRIELGEVVLQALHTPGHRPEHVALAVADTSRSDEPWLVLTGDSLFIGDVARPDLAVPGEEGARLLYDSLFGKLLSLPDGVEMYPAHVAGSLCGRVTNHKTSSTIGYERRHNEALEPRSPDEFVTYMTSSLPQRPPNMSAIVEANRQGTRRETNEVPALSPEEFSRLSSQGHLVLDARSPQQFGEGHVPGAINVHIDGGQFGTRVGFVVPPGAEILLLIETAAKLGQVRDALSVVGYDAVAGYLDGGMDAWQSSGLETASLPQIDVRALSERLGRPQPPTVLDVREQSEWHSGHIEHAIHIPFHQLQARMDEVPRTAVAVICGGGQRSSIAASLLRRDGREDVQNVQGGMTAWKREDYPTTSR